MSQVTPSNQDFVFFQSREPESFQFNDSKSCFQIHEESLARLNSKTLVSIFESLKLDSEELKTALRNSGLVPALNLRFSQLGKQEQIQALSLLCLLQKETDFYFYFLEEFYTLNQIRFLLTRLRANNRRVYFQGIVNPAPDLFLPFQAGHPHTLGEWKQQSAQLCNVYQGKIEGKDALSLKLGDMEFQLTEEEVEVLFSFTNREVLLSFGSQDMDLAKKEKKTHQKCTLLHQEEIGPRKWRYFIEFQDRVLEVLSPKRSSTPFVFARPSLLDCYFFHPESKQRIYPAQA